MKVTPSLYCIDIDSTRAMRVVIKCRDKVQQIPTVNLGNANPDKVLFKNSIKIALNAKNEIEKVYSNSADFQVLYYELVKDDLLIHIAFSTFQKPESFAECVDQFERMTKSLIEIANKISK